MWYLSPFFSNPFFSNPFSILKQVCCITLLQFWIPDNPNLWSTVVLIINLSASSSLQVLHVTLKWFITSCALHLYFDSCATPSPTNHTLSNRPHPLSTDHTSPNWPYFQRDWQTCAQRKCFAGNFGYFRVCVCQLAYSTLPSLGHS